MMNTNKPNYQKVYMITPASGVILYFVSLVFIIVATHNKMITFAVSLSNHYSPSTSSGRTVLKSIYIALAIVATRYFSFPSSAWNAYPQALLSVRGT